MMNHLTLLHWCKNPIKIKSCYKLSSSTIYNITHNGPTPEIYKGRATEFWMEQNGTFILSHCIYHHMAQLYQGYSRCLGRCSFDTQNINHLFQILKIILGGRIIYNLPNPSKSHKYSRLYCQQYSCVDGRNLEIAAKLQEFDCNVSNHVIRVSPFFSLPKCECLNFRAAVLLY